MPFPASSKPAPPARAGLAPWLKLIIVIAAVFGELILAGIIYAVGSLATTKLRAISEATTQDIPKLQSWLADEGRAARRYPTDQQYMDHYLPSHPYTNPDAVNSATGEAYLYKQIADGCSYTIQLVESPLGEGTDLIKTWTAPINLCIQ